MYDMILSILSNPWFYAVFLAIAFLGLSAFLGPLRKVGLTKGRIMFLGVIGLVFSLGLFSMAGLGSVGLDSSSDVISRVTLSGGLVNVTSTQDYYNSAEDVVTFQTTDSVILDGEEISFNATLERADIKEDARVRVQCTINDKALTGVTLENMAETTDGEIDLDIRLPSEMGALDLPNTGTDVGTHISDLTVERYIDFAEGTGSQVIMVAFDHEETWHDGMTNFDTVGLVSCNANGTPFTANIVSAG